jgi:hypothetical protein
VGAYEVETFRRTVITPDGRWLVSLWGRWNLASGAFLRAPIPWTLDDFLPALSPDGRYFAYVWVNPKAPPGAMVHKDFLKVYDLERGMAVGQPQELPILSNSSPLSFGTNPLRVCVFDYGYYAFAVPSLSQIGKWEGDKRTRDPLLDCTLPAAPAPPPHAELTVRLAPHVCQVGRFLLPRESCERAP